MTEFSASQAVIVDMLRSMKECVDALPQSNSMKNSINCAFLELRDSFASNVARELISDKLMFKRK